MKVTSSRFVVLVSRPVHRNGRLTSLICNNKETFHCMGKIRARKAEHGHHELLLVSVA